MAKGDHPYKAQPAKAFWRQTIQDHHFLEIPDWYSRKWPLSQARIATAGSCFAQHIGRRLRAQGFDYVDVEPPPAFLDRQHWLEYGYDMYSARYGNVYTARQLLQLLQRALGEFTPDEFAWARGEGYVDPFRPTIEPKPMTCPDEVAVCRQSHLEAVARLFEQTEVFVFTLGLTEAWVSISDGAVYPVCPGTQGGAFDDQRYKFVNYAYSEVRSDLEAFMQRARQINPKMRFLLTVSPVPLMATATQNQVAVATMYSKSVLRSVAGFLADKYRYVDYFPSFELVSSHVMHGYFYNSDMRTVVEAGVEHVMKHFFAEHVPPKRKAGKAEVIARTGDVDEDVVCDEALLAVFGEGK